VAKAGGEENRCYKIIGAKNAFHGRTFGAMSATPQEKIQHGFRPLVPGFSFGELNNLQSFADLIDEYTCGVIIETVQGESGINPATPEFLRGLRKLCDENNVLLLLDEVQCGIGRTGKFYACQHADVVPDAIAMAKGLGGGFPIGSMWVRDRVADLFHPGNHGTTFGGTPLACAAALAVLEIIERDNLMDKVRVQSGPWIAQLQSLVAAFPRQVLGARGLGYLVGVQMASDPAPYVASMRERGLLVPTAGNNVIRFLPPLNAAPEELGRSVEIFRSVLHSRAR
jgi:acetylornithine aminotransferase/acetylornithine/N-succinyldiaminopimelate aminotransferase